MALDYTDRALSRIIAQYRGDLKMRSLVSGLAGLVNNRLEQACDVRRLLYSIDAMQGAQLDLIGRVLVQPRPTVTNDDLVFFGYAGTPGAVGYNVAPYFDFAGQAQVLVPLPDPPYKKMLKAKAARNVTDCSIDDIIEIVEIVTGDAGIKLVNGHDMTFAITLSATPDELTTLLLNNVPFIPEPAGVRYTGWSVVP